MRAENPARAGGPRAERKQRKSHFCHGTDAIAAYDRSLSQYVVGKIRYLAEQWNFAADQRICAAYQSKNNGIYPACETGELLSLLRARPRQEQVGLILIPPRGEAR
jgi:hypothetical protein